MKTYEVIIIGGGPAGLSAALILGRCRRKVLVLDSEIYRNAHSQAVHGFLTRDGIRPAKLRQIARDQLLPYTTVEIQNKKVLHAEKRNDDFFIEVETGETVIAKKLLVATGLWDEWPQIKGAKSMYGKSIFHCPYCDGWEMRDQPLALFGRGDKNGAEAALHLMQWSKDIVLCSNGPSQLSPKYSRLLKKHQIGIRREQIVELIGNNGILEKIVFNKGKPLKRRAIFFHTSSPQKSSLPSMLGCKFDNEGSVEVGKFESTNVPGLFVAGDASKDVLQAIVAASSGVEAAMAINESIIKKDFLQLH